MAYLAGLEIIAWDLTLMLSAIVLVFWVAYTIMLYSQKKTGKVRHDWWISMVFYVGIVLLVLGNLFLAFGQRYHSEEGQAVSIILNVVSMLIFVFAFYLRMEHALHSRDMLQTMELSKPKRRKGR